MSHEKVIDLNEAMEFPRDGVFSKVLAKSDDSNHALICLAKGSDISEHTSTRDAAVTVLKGSGEFIMRDRKIVMKPGVFIFMPKNTPHALKADEDLAILLSLAGQKK